MTDQEILLLAIGVTAGMYLMLALQIVLAMRDSRRDRKAALTAVTRLEAARKRADA